MEIFHIINYIKLNPNSIYHYANLYFILYFLFLPDFVSTIPYFKKYLLFLYYHLKLPHFLNLVLLFIIFKNYIYILLIFSQKKKKIKLIILI